RPRKFFCISIRKMAAICRSQSAHGNGAPLFLFATVSIAELIPFNSQAGRFSVSVFVSPVSPWFHYEVTRRNREVATHCHHLCQSDTGKRRSNHRQRARPTQR